ncbi:MAG: OsmC family protein [Sphingobacteriales bacterium]|nr:OsmC family protein [Sphingobacteriales bacterium]
MTIKRKSTAVWKGNGTAGKGTISTNSGILSATPYSFKARFESEDGKAGTNPEELIAVAHAGCYSMALSFALDEAGFIPKVLNTDATVNVEKTENGFEISQIDLDLVGEVPGISEDEFKRLAEDAKVNCPISKALKAVKINLNVILKS